MRQEYKKRTHRYATITIELAQVSEQQFWWHYDHAHLPRALYKAALTLVAKVKETRGIVLAWDEPVDMTVVQLVAGTD